MPKWLIKLLMALGALCLLVSATPLQLAKANNLIAQDSSIPCFANPNSSLKIALRANGGSITFDFGRDYSGVAGLYTKHQGLDLGLGRAFDVVAVHSGTVISHDNTTGSGGILSWSLDEPYSNYVVKYFHQDVNSAIWPSINLGDHLSQGQPVGIANGSGSYSDGPHLHLQVEVDGVVVDPKSYLLCDPGAIAPYVPESLVAVPTTEYIDLPLLGDGSEAFRYTLSITVPETAQNIEPNIVASSTQVDEIDQVTTLPVNGVQYTILRKPLILILIVLIGIMLISSLIQKFPSSNSPGE